MEHVNEVLTLLVPVLVSILTVHVVDGIKRATAAKDRLPAEAKQILAVFVAYALVQLAAWSQVVLPGSLELVTDADVQGVLAAVGAWAIKAGQKRSA